LYPAVCDLYVLLHTLASKIFPLAYLEIAIWKAFKKGTFFPQAFEPSKAS
jgi:hypothetical protein